jgi:hypothetical protein
MSTTRTFQGQGRAKAREVEKRLADPRNWDALKHGFTNFRISDYVLAWLSKLESETGIKSHNSALVYLIENAKRESMILPASNTLIFLGDQPYCLTGPSGSGKSLWLKQNLQEFPGPLFLIDLGHEYLGLHNVDIGGFFDLKWAKADALTRIKFNPNANLDVSKGELHTIFGHLNMLKMEGHDPRHFPSGALSRWTIVVEESHRLRQDSAFINFLSEARKFTRKILIVASSPGNYGSICQLVKPPPLEELLAKVPVPELRAR